MRGLIVVVLVIGCWLGWLVRSARIQREAVAAIEKAGGEVHFDWEWKNGTVVPGGKPWEPARLVKLLGVDYFGQRRPSAFTQVTDRGLVHLKELTNLSHIDFSFTGVTDAGAKELKLALPNVTIVIADLLLMQSPWHPRCQLRDAVSAVLHSWLSRTRRPGRSAGRCTGRSLGAGGSRPRDSPGSLSKSGPSVGSWRVGTDRPSSSWRGRSGRVRPLPVLGLPWPGLIGTGRSSSLRFGRRQAGVRWCYNRGRRQRANPLTSLGRSLMSHIRFRIRTIMIIIAVVAVLMIPLLMV